jgi:hypothetical protein
MDIATSMTPAYGNSDRLGGFLEKFNEGMHSLQQGPNNPTGLGLSFAQDYNEMA